MFNNISNKDCRIYLILYNEKKVGVFNLMYLQLNGHPIKLIRMKPSQKPIQSDPISKHELTVQDVIDNVSSFLSEGYIDITKYDYDSLDKM